MKHIITILLTLICLPIIAFAVPPVEWIHSYDYGGDEAFWDIYDVPNDGFALCGCRCNHGEINNGDAQGDMLIVRVGEDGQERWNHIRDLDDGRGYLEHIIETDSATFITAGFNLQFEGNHEDFNTAALHVDQNGELVWYREFGDGELYSVIELKSGEFLFAGSSEDQSCLICTDFNGNVIWDDVYGDFRISVFYAMRETQGGVVVVGYCWSGNGYNIWVCKISFDGEVIWERIHNISDFDMGLDVYACRDDGFLIGGKTLQAGMNNPHRALILKIDDEGELIWSRVMTVNQGESYSECKSIIAMPNDDIVIVGKTASSLQGENSLPYAKRIYSNGQSDRWTSMFDFGEVEGYQSGRNWFRSVIADNQESLVCAGSVNNADNDRQLDGLLLKLLPDVVNPQFISWTPEDTILTVLVGDTIDFRVEVADDNLDEISYTWTLAEDEISRVDSARVIFAELEECEVRCVVSDPELSIPITWHITVSDFFIRETAPDTLHITARRGSTHCPSRLMSRALSRMRPLSSGQRSTAITTANIWAKRIRLTCCSISLASGLSKLKRSGVKSVNPFAGMSPSAPPSGGGCRMRTRSRSINTNEAISQSFPSTRTRIV